MLEKSFHELWVRLKNVQTFIGSDSGLPVICQAEVVSPFRLRCVLVIRNPE